MSDWIFLTAGGLLLYFGAEWFVGGASALAAAIRVPPLVIGLTVVAYGTSAPELVVSMQASANGHADVALGNVIGSNVANIGLILGLSAMVRPARVHGALRLRELPVLMLSAALVPVVMADGRIARWEALGLLLIGVTYTGWMVRGVRGSRAVEQARVDAEVTATAADAAGAPRAKGALKSSLVAAIGLGTLLVGGSLFVGSAVQIAHSLGMTDSLVGLTIVAVGTSVPELVTSMIAAVRGHSDIAIGNVVGSNICNVFLCLGGAALVGEVGAELSQLAVELGMMVLMTMMAATFMRSERSITRWEGAFALIAYMAFNTFLVLRA